MLARSNCARGRAKSSSSTSAPAVWRFAFAGAGSLSSLQRKVKKNGPARRGPPSPTRTPAGFPRGKSASDYETTRFPRVHLLTPQLRLCTADCRMPVHHYRRLRELPAKPSKNSLYRSYPQHRFARHAYRAPENGLHRAENPCIWGFSISIREPTVQYCRQPELSALICVVQYWCGGNVALSRIMADAPTVRRA
jgi:hypothetical protein